MRSQMKDMIVMLLLVATPTTWSGVTVAASRIIKVTTGSSTRTLIKPNVKRPDKPDSKSHHFSPPPPGHDFTKIPPGARYAPGKLLVRFAPLADGTQQPVAEKERIVRRLGGRVMKHYRLVPGLVVVALPPWQSVRMALIIYNRVREILHASPCYIYRIPELPRPKPAPRPIPPARKPSVLRPHSPGLRIRHFSPARRVPQPSALRRR